MTEKNENQKKDVFFIDVRKPGRPVANNTLVVDQIQANG